ncbi:MAG: hypothetical protein ACOC2Y_06110 [Spirochaetota bacterium]
MKRIAILVVFAALAVPRLAADIAVTAGSRQTALVVQVTPFNVGAQLLSEIALGFDHTWVFGETDGSLHAPSARNRAANEVTLSGGLAVGSVSASALVQDGSLYRGLATRTIWLAGAWRSPGGAGAALAVRAVAASYAMTTRLLFYPEIEVAPLYRLRVGDSAYIDWSVPIFRQFRADLTISGGVGISGRLGLEISPP